MNVNKRDCYKIELLYNKYIPFVISVILFIYHVLRILFQIDLEWIQYLCMPSLFTTFHMYNTRETFGFCKTHRCAVNYVVGNLFACIVEHYWVVPFMNVWWAAFVILGTLLAICLCIHYYRTEHEALNSKLTEEDSKRLGCGNYYIG